MTNSRGWLALGLAAALAGALVGRAGGATPPVPEEPHAPWIPTAGEKLPPLALPAAPALPATAPGAALQVTLPQVLDLALRNSPATRNTWLAARASAAEVGSRASSYWPKLNLQATATRQHSVVGGGAFTFDQTTYGPGIDLTFLLLDFGGRRGDVEDARAALLAADWQHNQAIQDLVLRVERAYYQYLAAMSLAESLAADVRQAEKTLEVAQGRHDAGLATIADVLQARTQLAREQLLQVRTEGRMKEVKGALAIAVGLPPDVAVEPAGLPTEIPALAAAESVRQELDRALGERPELQAARQKALAATHHVAKVRAEGLPTLALGGAFNRIYYASPSGIDPFNNYSATLALRFPLFTGFANRFDLEQARAEAQLAASRVEALRQQVTTEVWTAYYELEAAAQAVAASRALVASARQSADVAAGRYQAGVGDLLELLTAQAALADANAQEIQARADWFTAVAQLAHDSGALAPPPAAPPAATSSEGLSR